VHRATAEITTTGGMTTRLPFARTAITTLIRLPARHMDITVLHGFTTGFSSAQAHGGDLDGVGITAGTAAAAGATDAAGDITAAGAGPAGGMAGPEIAVGTTPETGVETMPMAEIAPMRGAAIAADLAGSMADAPMAADSTETPCAEVAGSTATRCGEAVASTVAAADSTAVVEAAMAVAVAITKARIYIARRLSVSTGGRFFLLTVPRLRIG
jgi:hypothetical protein